MKIHTPLIYVCVVSVAAVAGCADTGPSAPRAPISPRPALLDRFNDFRGQTPDVTDDRVMEDADLDDLFAPVGETVEVEGGRIVGDIGPVTVDAETEHHLGAVEEFDAYSFLFLSAAAETESGVAMFMMYIDEGFDSPLFTEGVLRGGQPVLDDEALADLTDEELQELFTATTVLGCSGETLAQIDWDQSAVDYELRATTDEADPQLFTVEISASFIDPYTERELSAEGSMQVRRPD